MPRPLGPLFDVAAGFLPPSLRLRARNVLALTGGGEDRVDYWRFVHDRVAYRRFVHDRVAYRCLFHNRSACGRLGHDRWRGYRTLAVIGVGCVASKYLRLHRDGSYLVLLSTSNLERLGTSNLEYLGTSNLECLSTSNR